MSILKYYQRLDTFMTISISQAKKSTLTRTQSRPSKQRDTLLADAFRSAFYLKPSASNSKSAGTVNLGNIKVKFYRTPDHFKMNMNSRIYNNTPTSLTLENSTSAMNVSLSDLLYFIEHNSAGKRKYTSGSFMCGDFSALIHNRAESAGIRCGFVSIDYTKEYNDITDCKGHAIVVFLTTDHGIYFADIVNNIGYNERDFQQKYKYLADGITIFV